VHHSSPLLSAETKQGTFVPLHTKEGKYRIPAVKSAIEEHRGKPANAPQNINATSTARPNPPGRVFF